MKKQQTPIQLGVMRGLTDVIYRALFGMTTWELLKHFGLSAHHMFDDQDNELRDCMGIHALKALAEIESQLTRQFKSFELMPEQWAVIADNIAALIGAEYEAKAELSGVDFLTGEEQSA